MSLLKLAVYGGLGYLAYQMFFAELEPSERLQRRSGQQRGQKSRQGQQVFSPRGPQMTGGGEGIDVSTKERGGASTTHRVGRGVI